VASSVATMFTLIIIMLLLQASVIGTIPAKQYEAERLTSFEAVAAFGQLRSMSAALATPGDQFSVTFPLGTAAVSPFAVATLGTLRFDPAGVAHANASYKFVPNLYDARLSKIDQDVVLAIDSSGSMVWNDPDRLRISGAKDYVTHLTYPDRIAVVDFDGIARLTKTNVGLEAHHLYSDGHYGPDYTEVETDLDTIDQDGLTNYGAALQVANDELITYGDHGHAWVIILLTDGENSVGGADALARSQSLRAAASGITIYTIGLGPDVNEALLTEIAQNTGGTYYAAPTAESIRYIYFEIAMQFKGFITCGTLTAANSMGGSLSLSLLNRHYPAQTISMESSGVTVVQQTGGLIQEGVPVRLEPSGLGTGTLHLTLLSFVGPAFSTTGSDYQFLTGQFLGATIDETTITRPSLENQSREVENISAFVEFWGNEEGLATPGAIARVRAILDQASERLEWGEANMTAKKPTLAKFNTDSAQSQLGAAALQIELEADANEFNRTLASAVNNDILRVSCQLDQFLNWYNGVSFTIQSPSAAAWAVWFNETFASSGVPIAYGLVGDQVVLTIRAIDRFIMDERVIAVRFY
jgi:Mg-chelatase subunit ChlD